MPPKTDLLTAGTEPTGKIRASARPLTTQGKMMKALAKAQPQPESRPPPFESDRPAKPRSFPPPGEMTEMERITRLRRGKKRQGWDFDRNKPLTTQQKQRKAKIMKKAQGGPRDSDVEDGNGSSCSGDGNKKREKGKQWNTKAPGMLTILLAQSIPEVEVPKRSMKTGVLYRPTERAKKWKRENPNVAVPLDIGYQTSSVLKLPQEVLEKIYILVVVEQRSIVWPDSLTGREQPDLAMTCREVREAVLRIYYSRNTFGIVISRPTHFKTTAVARTPERGSKSTAPVHLSGMAAVQKWAMTLSEKANEGGKWFAQIRKWAFEFADPNAMAALRGIRELDDSGFLISMCFPELQAEQPLEDGAGWEGAERYTRSKNPVLEIHREAPCILEGWKECGQCVVQNTPAVLNAAVIRMLGASSETGDLVRASPFLDFAMELRDMSESLRAARCVHHHSSYR